MGLSGGGGIHTAILFNNPAFLTKCVVLSITSQDIQPVALQHNTIQHNTIQNNTMCGSESTKEAEFFTQKTCLSLHLVSELASGHSEAGSSETWASVTRNQPETRYPQEAMEDQCTSSSCSPSWIHLVCSSSSARVQMSTVVSFKHSGIKRPLVWLDLEWELGEGTTIVWLWVLFCFVIVSSNYLLKKKRKTKCF